ncbi:MAG: hypothetical protein ACFE9D_04595 [Promethearchaeota archaeon]
METEEQIEEATVRRFLRSHWKMVLMMGVGIAIAVIVAIYVLLWVVSSALLLGLIPNTLGSWSVGILWGFFFIALFWELVSVASWVIPIAIAIWALWYRKLPEEERKDMESPRKRSRDAGGGGGFSFFITLIWLAIVWFTGRWSLALNAWLVADFVFTWLVAFLIALVPLAIGGLIFLAWWMTKGTKAES